MKLSKTELDSEVLEWDFSKDMAKQKNTRNKKLHSKLIAQKKTRKQNKKEANRLKIKEMNRLANQKKEAND